MFFQPCLTQTQYVKSLNKKIKFCIIFLFTLFSFTSCKVYYQQKKEKTNLVPTIDFLQDWFCEDWSEEKWNKVIDEMKGLGYEAFIIQFTADVDNYELCNSLYEKDENTNRCFLDFLLPILKEKEMGLYFGLISDSEWWNTENYQSEKNAWWIKKCNLVADNLYKKYYETYQNQFLGWYFPFECYENTSGYETSWAELYNGIRDHLYEINPTLPLLFSPYQGSVASISKNEEYKMWKHFFSLCHFTSIDWCLPQDGYGRFYNEVVEEAKDVHSNRVSSYLEAMYTALLSTPCQFVVNLELFTPTEKVFCTEERKTRQKEIANRYASLLISFSYSYRFYQVDLS
jgi:hypothetical protein